MCQFRVHLKLQHCDHLIKDYICRPIQETLEDAFYLLGNTHRSYMDLLSQLVFLKRIVIITTFKTLYKCKENALYKNNERTHNVVEWFVNTNESLIPGIIIYL